MNPKAHKWVGAFRAKPVARFNRLPNLKQVISTHLGGTVSLQAIGTLNLTAGGNPNLTGSTMDLKDANTGAHGLFNDATMMTSTISAKPCTTGAGYVW